MYVQCRYAVQIPKNSRYVNILSQNEKKRSWIEFDLWTHLQSNKENISPLIFNYKHLTIVALVSQKRKKKKKNNNNKACTHEKIQKQYAAVTGNCCSGWWVIVAVVDG